MNVRIDEDSVRFRITPAELSTLLDGGEIHQRVSTGIEGFGFGIVPVPPGGDMALEMTGRGFVLSVPRSTLEQVRDMGRSKEGISVRQGEAEISLQVDLKPAARHAS